MAETGALPLCLEDRETLLRGRGECTLVWSRRDGWPVGVTMGYVWTRDRFWLCTGPDRPRVAAVRRDPRVSIIVSDAGRSVTAVGRCRLREDEEARSWVYREFAAHQGALFPDLIDATAFENRLARMQQTILEIEPLRFISYDGLKAPVA